MVLSSSNYCQGTWKQKQRSNINQKAIIGKWQKKAMGNITPAMNYYPRIGNIIDTDPIYNKP